MRTRTMQDPDQAIVTRLEQETGCRVHIERSRREVRLFGPSPGAQAASKRLDELGAMCCEEVVPVPIGNVSPEALQVLAHDCRVTLRVEDMQIVVLGLQDYVNKATFDLKKLILEVSLGVSPQKQASVQALPGGSSGSAMVEDSGMQPQPMQTSLGVVVTQMPTEASISQPLSSGKQQFIVRAPFDNQNSFGGNPRSGYGEHRPGKFVPVVANTGCGGGGCGRGCAGHSQVATGHIGNCAGVCPTCGVGNFCPSCGVPVWQNQTMFPENGSAPTSSSKPPGKYNDVKQANGGYFGMPDSDGQSPASPPWAHMMAYDQAVMQSQAQQHHQQQFLPQHQQQQQPRGNNGSRAGGGMQGQMVPVSFTNNQRQHGMFMQGQGQESLRSSW